MTREEALDALLARQEISDRLMRYCRGIDRRDEELIRAVYHEDAYDDHGLGGRTKGWEMARIHSDGRGPFKAAQHFLGNLLIEVNGDVAASEAYFFALQRFEHDGADYDFIIGGRYLDEWERRAGDYRIAHRTIVWDWMRTEQVITRWPGPDHEVPKGIWGGPELDTSGAHFGEPSSADYSYRVFKPRA